MAGALWDIQSDQTVYNDYYYCGAGARFQNAGTVRKSGGTGTTSISIPFNNAGTVEVEEGTLQFNGGGSVGGQHTRSEERRVGKECGYASGAERYDCRRSAERRTSDGND